MGVVPRKNSKRYKEIVALGCGLYRIDTDWGYDYDCEHGYSWDCDYCPVLTEKEDSDD